MKVAQLIGEERKRERVRLTNVKLNKAFVRIAFGYVMSHYYNCGSLMLPKKKNYTQLNIELTYNNSIYFLTLL